MTLTNEQQQALDRGEAVEATLDGRDCVVLTRATYEHFRRVLDDGLSSDIVCDLIERNMAELDADDPSLESYQKYKAQP